MNAQQARALEREHDPLVGRSGLPKYDWPRLPAQLASEERRSEIEAELLASEADVIITLGDQPLRWFPSSHGSHAALSEYGQTPEDYGRLHQFRVAGRNVGLLPLVHPSQAAGLGSHSSGWAELHKQWLMGPSVEVVFS
jgi:uracil-DNA glycosylase